MAITLKYNNIPSESATSFICFSDVPNILEINDSTGGTKALLQLTVGTGWTATSNGQWWITFQNNTISNVTDPKLAVNKNFYIAPDAHSTAVSICNALRNCPTVAASFVVYVNGNKVICYARQIGPVDMEVSMTEGLTYITVTKVAGTADSSLVNNKITVDVYSNYNYVTTLQKNYHVGNCKFDMTPVLVTMAEYGTTVPYEFEINALDESGTSTNLGSITGNSIAQGYQVNQGFNYIPLGNMPSDFIIAQNVSRGTDKSWDNNTTLYLYGNTIPVSWYSKSKSSITCEVQYLSSAYAAVHTDTITLSDSTLDGWLHNATVTLSENYKTSAYYIGLIFTDSSENTLGTLMYNIIKPLKATEYYQRIYWRNSYGGVSYFDFTASKSESRDIETTTYNKNVYDYYTQDVNEKAIPYDNAVNYSVTLKSHLIEKDGTYIFNDLIQSPNVWTEVNSETYRIILDSVSVDEDNRNDLYTATIKYKYSQSL